MNKSLESLSKELGVPFIEKIENKDLKAEILSKLPLSFMRKYKFVPIKMEGDVISLATHSSFDLNIFDDIGRTLGLKVDLVLAELGEIERAIENYVSASQTTHKETIDEINEPDLEMVTKEEDKTEDLLDLAAKPPVIRLVNMIIFEAVKKRATDIHVQPYEDSLRVRYRVDGMLYEVHNLPKHRQAAIISRIKVMSKLDIAEQRLPQDGRTTIKIGRRAVDIRVSCVPTSFGERIVLRLLDKGVSFLKLNQIGFSPFVLDQIERLINLPNGIILVTGPTGSGKTTTLYAVLSEIDTSRKNIITIEDPIEYHLSGVSQIQVKPKIDLTFASGLRSVLRQDPDVIMVGEIRDKETATIAIQSALTGHLVFSTLHTNDACGAVTRLMDLGIEPYLISSSIIGVLAQRLIRLTCPHCAESYIPDAKFLKSQSFNLTNLPTVLYKGKGCEECLNTGFKGRNGIFELFILNEEIKQMILARGSKGDINLKAREAGMGTLFQDGLDKVLKGVTTIEEIVRVTHYDSA